MIQRVISSFGISMPRCRAKVQAGQAAAVRGHIAALRRPRLRVRCLAQGAFGGTFPRSAPLIRRFRGRFDAGKARYSFLRL